MLLYFIQKNCEKRIEALQEQLADVQEHRDALIFIILRIEAGLEKADSPDLLKDVKDDLVYHSFFIKEKAPYETLFDPDARGRWFEENPHKQQELKRIRKEALIEIKKELAKVEKELKSLNKGDNK